MKRIKRFEELNEGIKDNPKASQKLLHHLKEGEAILIKKEDINKFYDTLGYYSWIDFTKHPKDVLPEETYFVLIGNKIYHTDKHSFGGQDFVVYEPTWEDLKPYKEIE